MLHTLVTDGPARAFGLVPYLLMGGVLFGLPVVCLVILAVALPSFALLRLLRLDFTLARALVLGAGSGVAARELVRGLLGRPESDFVPLVVVLLTGAATAWIVWRGWADGKENPVRGRGTI